MKYSTERIRAYRSLLNIIEKVISIPARGLLIILSFLAVYPPVEIIDVVGGDQSKVAPLIEQLQRMRIISYGAIAYFVASVVMWILIFVWKKSKESLQMTRILLLIAFIIDIAFLSLLLSIGETPGVTSGETGEAVAGRTGILSGTTIEGNIFWIFCFVIIRSVIYFPEIIMQIAITGGALIFYYIGYHIGDYEKGILGFRLIILVLVNVSAWGLYTIYQRWQEMENEEQEKTIRVERLNLAGLVAKETAHSLKNPLAIINNACYLLSKKVDKNNTDASEHLSIIKKQVQRADGIITELTKYSELASGKIGTVDVNKEVGRCIKDLEYEIKERKITIVQELEPLLPKLIIDDTQLRQVLSNIILNACQAIEHQKGRIIIRTNTDSKDNIIIEIEDNGKGIEKKDLDNVFRSYYTTKEGGTGIGLSIAHTIIQAFDGTIDVESEKRKRSKFIVFFPTRTHRTG